MTKRFAIAALLVAASMPVTGGVVESVSSPEAAAALPTDQAQLREIVGASFCHTENGKDDCGTFRFLHVWRFADGAWQVSRIISYGH